MKWFFKYKESLECLLCKENEPVCLEFHHIDQRSKRFSIGTAISKNYSIKTIKEEIDLNCVILCSNCHKKFHAKKLTTKEKNILKEHIFKRFYEDIICTQNLKK